MLDIDLLESPDINGNRLVSLVTSPAIMKRSAWIQAYCQCVATRRTSQPLDCLAPQARHHPLEAIANAWSRLLVLIGWRR